MSQGTQSYIAQERTLASFPATDQLYIFWQWFWLSVSANYPWLVTEPEASGVPGWQIGTKALCLLAP